MTTGRILLDIEGLELSSEEKEILKHPQVAGVILFARNYTDSQQLSSLTHSIHRVRNKLIIAADQEGGRVQRFVEGFTRLPAMRHWGELYAKDKHQAQNELTQTMTIMVRELQQHGIDISLAPVLDIDHGLSQVIGERSFHANPEIVCLLGECAINAMHTAKMLAVGKHFPGHGGVIADSHSALPIDMRSREEITNTDLVPFKTLIPKLHAIMPSHVIYQAFDSKPAVFSSYWLRQMLRQQLGFKGLIISDDLTMAAAATMGSYEERAHIALTAGCDLLSVCNNRNGTITILEGLEGYSDPEADPRIKFYIDKIR